jgi:hypothetical protein
VEKKIKRAVPTLRDVRQVLRLMDMIEHSLRRNGNSWFGIIAVNPKKSGSVNRRKIIIISGLR